MRGIYLQEEYDSTHDMTESLTGEILRHGLYYTERRTQEGQRAP